MLIFMRVNHSASRGFPQWVELHCDDMDYIFPPGAGKCFLFTEVFLAKDQVPVGTRSVAKTEVNKKHLRGSKSSSYQSGNPKRDVTFGSPDGIYMLKQWEIGHFRRRFSSTFNYNTT